MTGDGELKTQTRTVRDFKAVEAIGGMTVLVTQGTNTSVRIEADGNLLSYIETELDGDELEIRPRRGYNLRPRAHIKVYVTAPVYNSLSVTGSGKIQSQNKITNPGSIKVGVTGSGDVVLDTDAPTVDSEIAGSGSITLTGATRNFGTEISGSGEVHGFNLQSEASRVEIAGSGTVEVSASKQLDVDIAGSGDVFYKGNPAINQSIAGSGNIKRAQ